MSELRLNLFGAPRLERDGQAIVVESRKALALLAYLAVTQQAHSRDTIAALFWPDLDHTGARATLRSTLWMLKKVCGEWVEAERETIAIKAEVGAEIDVVAFERTLATCRTHGHPENVPCPACLPLLDTAVELYKGDFLEGFTLRDSPGFEDWQILYSENLRHQFAQALECLTKHHEGQGAFDIALRPARRWLALDLLHEPAHQALMRLYAQAGQIQSALRQYDLCRQALEKELGVSPQRATQDLYRAIQEDRLQAYLGKPATLKGNLSAHMPPTSFVGRENDLAEIAARLDDSACRLLTLIGPGGIGKTRMAQQVAWQLTEKLVRYPDGVFFVPLSGVQSPEFLVSTIVTALHFPLSGPIDPKAQLLNYLREKHMLLVLDNFEQLVEGKDLLHDILAHTRAVKLLVTSRERLMLADEWLYEILGLTYPPHEGVETFKGFSSVELFLQRAQRRHSIPSFWEREKQGIVRICQLVQGMPLGVELAATWVRGLSCQEIAQELERNLDRLSTTHQNLPDRHRSIRAVFDQSWACLTEAEQTVFCRLSVFRGGFRREAAEQVAGASLPILMSLVDKSFLQRDSAGRYTIHELLRQYGVEQLHYHPQDERVTKQQHCGYFAVFLAEREYGLKGSKQLETLEEIAGETENIWGSWYFAVAQHDLNGLNKSLASLALFLERKSQFQEGEKLFQSVLTGLQSHDRIEGGSQSISMILGRLRIRLGVFLFHLGLHPQAAEFFHQGISILRSFDVQEDIALALLYLGQISHVKMQFEQAQIIYQEGLGLIKTSEDRWIRALGLGKLGISLVFQKKYEAGRKVLYESLELSQEIQDQVGIAQCLNSLAVLASMTGNPVDAQNFLEESLDIRKKLNDQVGMAQCMHNLAFIAFEINDFQKARAFSQKSFAILSQIGYRDQAAYSLTLQGYSTMRLKEYSEAESCFRKGLKIALEIKSDLRVLEILYSVANLLEEQQSLASALELFTFIVNHPACNQDVISKSQPEIKSLVDRLEPHISISAQERGKARTLESIVNEILAEKPEVAASP